MLSSHPLAVTPDARVAATQRPAGEPAGFQRWSDLLFVHWRVPVSAIRDMIPAELDIDTHDGFAWVGLVPFYMSRVRPAMLPAVPWISNFCETNLRTYVHRQGQAPGVWFFSLEASRLLPVVIARTFWHLNYRWARMQLDRTEEGVVYSSRRLMTREPAMSAISATIGDAIAPPEPGSLEYFLAERYVLYAQSRGGNLLLGRVHHAPYPLRAATLVGCAQTITAANGIDCSGPPDHVLFSDGVKVEVFALAPP